MQKQTYIVWFDIPVNDLKMAMNFYSKLLQITLKEESFGDMSMAVFPYEKTIGGCIYKDNKNLQ